MIAWFLLSLLIFLSAGLLVQESYAFNHDYEIRTSVDFSISHEPKLNEEAQIVFRIYPSDFEWSKLGGAIVLPQSLVPVGGELEKWIEWDPDAVVEIKSTVKAVKTGKWIIFAYDSSGIRHSLPVSILGDDGTYGKEKLIQTPNLFDEKISSDTDNSTNKISNSLQYHLNDEVEKIEVLILQSIHGEPPLDWNWEDQKKYHIHKTSFADLINRNIIEFLVFNNSTTKSKGFDWIVAEISPDLIPLLSTSRYIESLQCNIEYNCGILINEGLIVIPDDTGIASRISGTVNEQGCKKIDGAIVKSVKTDNNPKKLCKYENDYYLIITRENCTVENSIIIDRQSGGIYQFFTSCDVPNSFDAQWTSIESVIKKPFTDKKLIFESIICKNNYVPILKNNGGLACVKSTSVNKLIDRNWGMPISFNYNPLFEIIPKSDDKEIELLSVFSNSTKVQTKDGIFEIFYSADGGKILDTEVTNAFEFWYLNNKKTEFSVAVPKDLMPDWNYTAIFVDGEDILEFEEIETNNYRIVSFDMSAGKKRIIIVPILLK